MWKDLTLAQKSKIIGMSVRNGVTDLNQIRELYNKNTQLNESSGETLMQPTGNLNTMADGTSLGNMMPGSREYTQRKYAEGGNLFAKRGSTYTPSSAIKAYITQKEGSSMYSPAPDTGKVNRSFEAEARDFRSKFTDAEWDALTDTEKDALYSYSYNVGSGNFAKRVMPTLRKYINGEASKIDVANSMWATKDSDPNLRGLAKRRAEERSLFVTGSFDNASDYIFAPSNRPRKGSGQVLWESESSVPKQFTSPSIEFEQDNSWLDTLFNNEAPSVGKINNTDSDALKRLAVARAIQEQQQQRQLQEAYTSLYDNDYNVYNSSDLYDVDNIFTTEGNLFPKGGIIGVVQEAAKKVGVKFPFYNKSTRRWYNSKGQKLPIGFGYYKKEEDRYVQYNTDGTVTRYTPKEWAQSGKFKRSDVYNSKNKKNTVDYIGGNKQEVRKKLWEKHPAFREVTDSIANAYGINSSLLRKRLDEEGFTDGMVRNHNQSAFVAPGGDYYMLSRFTGPPTKEYSWYIPMGMASYGLDDGYTYITEGKVHPINEKWDDSEFVNEKGRTTFPSEGYTTYDNIGLTAAHLKYFRDEAKKFRPNASPAKLDEYVGYMYNMGVAGGKKYIKNNKLALGGDLDSDFKLPWDNSLDESDLKYAQSMGYFGFPYNTKWKEREYGVEGSTYKPFTQEEVADRFGHARNYLLSYIGSPGYMKRTNLTKKVFKI